MNAIVPFLNQAGVTSFQFAAGMAWQASLVIAVVFVLDLLLRDRARAALRYALWLLVLVKLLLPPTLALPTGIGYWIQVAKAEQPASVFPPATAVIASTHPEMPEAALGVPTSVPNPRLRREGLILASWAGGTVIFLVVLLFRSWRLARLVKAAEPVQGELQALSNAYAEELKVGKSIPVRASDRLGSPAVCGLWAPVMLLPRDLIGRLSGDQLRPILLHELLHVKRRDVWLNCLQALLQAIYWWHPLVWFANARIRRTREEAVDEGVMVALGEQAPVYPTTLLEVAKGALQRPMTALGLVGIFESRSALHQRIRRLVDRPVPHSATLNLLGFTAVLTVGAVVIPMAQGYPNDSGETEVPSIARESVPADAPQVQLDFGIFDVHDRMQRRLEQLAKAETSANGQRVWVLERDTLDQFRTALKNDPGSTEHDAPRLTVLAGMPATISSTRARMVNGETALLGTTCEAMVWPSADSLLVKVKSTFSEVDDRNPDRITEHLIADLVRAVPSDCGLVVLNPRVGATRHETTLLLLVDIRVLEPTGVDRVEPSHAEAARSHTVTPAGVQVTSKPKLQPPLIIRVYDTEPFYSIRSERMDAAQIEALLRERSGELEQLTVEIQVSRDAPMSVLIRLMDLLRDAGTPSVSLVTLNGQSESPTPTPPEAGGSHEVDPRPLKVEDGVDLLGSTQREIETSPRMIDPAGNPLALPQENSASDRSLPLQPPG